MISINQGSLLIFAQLLFWLITIILDGNLKNIKEAGEAIIWLVGAATLTYFFAGSAFIMQELTMLLYINGLTLTLRNFYRSQNFKIDRFIIIQLTASLILGYLYILTPTYIKVLGSIGALVWLLIVTVLLKFTKIPNNDNLKFNIAFYSIMGFIFGANNLILIIAMWSILIAILIPGAAIFDKEEKYKFSVLHTTTISIYMSFVVLLLSKVSINLF